MITLIDTEKALDKTIILNKLGIDGDFVNLKNLQLISYLMMKG